MFKNITITKNLRTIVQNFFSLSVMYGLDLLLPLLAIPYLIRYIGIDKVGLINFAMAVIAYFGIVINYGFNLTATKEIALNVDNPERLQKIYNNVTTAKLFLIAASSIILLILLAAVPRFREYYYLYIIMFLGVSFQNLIPIWFFQGLQNLKSITIQNGLSKLFFTGLIFVLVKKQEDFWIVSLLTSAGFFLAFILAYLHLRKVYQIRFYLSSVKEVTKQLKSGMYVFLSQLKISFFSTFNILILGFIAGNTAVGYFTSADKIVRALALVQIPVLTALFPYFSSLLKTNKTEAYKKINKVAIFGSIIYLPIILFSFFFAEEIVKLIFGPHMENVAIILRILCLLPLLILLNNLSGTQMLLNMGRDKYFFKVLLSTAILNIILVIPLTYKYSIFGTAFSVLISELYLCITMYVVFVIAKKQY